jgi:hypothetical protein
MQRRVIRRAAAAALIVLGLATAAAYADTVPADGDGLTAGNQTTIDLGQANPGQVLTWPVRFRLTCAGTSHAEVGSTITVAYETDQSPEGGSATATTTTIGPVPASWPAPGEGCSSPAQTLLSNATSTVTLTMPATPGLDREFLVVWSRTGTGLTSMTVMTFIVDIVGNTPPALQLPGNMTVEATSAAGAAVTWSATATDVEDATTATPTCTPASGSTFPLGATTVSCSVTDGGGLKASGSFVVTVADTTAPAFAQVADYEIVTSDPTGASLTYAMAYFELVDPAPTIVCSPESGSTIPVGTTTVTCTARDASGNQGTTSFNVTVRYVPAVVWTAVWREPIGSNGATLVANAGRTVPIRVEIFANGVRQTAGSARLVVTTCAGAAVTTVTLAPDGGRWSGLLDTASLGATGCYDVTVTLDGHAAGSFRIDLRGGTPLKEPAMTSTSLATESTKAKTKTTNGSDKSTNGSDKATKAKSKG